MNPPLAAREDREALLAGIADGTVDAIATDHAPHEPALKDVEFDRAPFGILGSKRPWRWRWSNWVKSGRISADAHGAALYRGSGAHSRHRTKDRPGPAADLTIFSTDHAWTYDVKKSRAVAQLSLRRPLFQRSQLSPPSLRAASFIGFRDPRGVSFPSIGNPQSRGARSQMFERGVRSSGCQATSRSAKRW